MEPPRDATLCELGARLPADGRWRGMHHASQFQCVSASLAGGGERGRPFADFEGDNRPLVMNQCRAVRCAGGDASCAESRPVSPTGTALEPVLECRALASMSEAMVGFASVTYLPYGGIFAGTNPDYRGGCVNEDAEFSEHFCPPDIFRTDSVADGFGRQTCYLAPCPLGRADCVNEWDGCETVATSLEQCSHCTEGCDLPNATEECDTGLCRIVPNGCDASWGDCNNDPSDGL